MIANVAPPMCDGHGLTSMCLSNVIGNHHVQYNGMFTITTHFMAKHMLEDDEMLKKGLVGKGLIMMREK